LVEQLLVDGIVSGALIAVLSVGFALTYMSARFFVFTYGSCFAIGAYILLATANALGYIAAASAGLLAALVAGIALETFLYGIARRRETGPLILMLLSIGAYMIIQNFISLLFGDMTRSIRTWPTAPGDRFLHARITSIQLLTLGVSGLALVSVWGVMRFTTLGRRLRALANDYELAAALGLDVAKLTLVGVAIGSALAGLAGVMSSFDTDLVPTMGFQALLFGIVGAIAGGVNNLWGAALGGMILGILRQLVVWRLPSQWQDGSVFLVLLLFLILRPQGLFGRPLKAGVV
jgi:branched-chain amino acid transport system permease protein